MKGEDGYSLNKYWKPLACTLKEDGRAPSEKCCYFILPANILIRAPD